MRRSDRLFSIIQVLRSKRRPVTGAELAQELEVSLRTLYRDMAELIAQRVPIRGEAGTGYVLESGYELPPLMLTPDELEAAVLGAAWVAQHGDAALACGARDLVAKLTVVVPARLRPILLDAGLHPVSFNIRAPDRVSVADVRLAIRDQRKLRLSYATPEGAVSDRTVWPFMIAYMEQVRIIAAFCELRGDFRHFRTDRVRAAQLLSERYAESPVSLRRRWAASRDADKAARDRRGAPAKS